MSIYDKMKAAGVQIESHAGGEGAMKPMNLRQHNRSRKPHARLVHSLTHLSHPEIEARNIGWRIQFKSWIKTATPKTKKDKTT